MGKSERNQRNYRACYFGVRNYVEELVQVMNILLYVPAHIEQEHIVLHQSRLMLEFVIVVSKRREPML